MPSLIADEDLLSSGAPSGPSLITDDDLAAGGATAGLAAGATTEEAEAVDVTLITDEDLAGLGRAPAPEAQGAKTAPPEVSTRRVLSPSAEAWESFKSIPDIIRPEAGDTPLDIVSKQAKGIGRFGTAALQTAFLPLSIPARALAGDPVRRITGSETGGMVAELGAELGLGVGVGSAIPKAYRALRLYFGGTQGRVPKGKPQALRPEVFLQNKGIVDKAGNINLKNIGAPDDVKEIIRMTAPDIERRVVSNEETIEAAATLGFNLNKLPAAMTAGARSAELLAMRDVLVASATGARELAKAFRSGTPGAEVAFDEALRRHRGIQQTVSGHVAEAGRTLQALKIKAGERLDASGTLDEIAKRLVDPDATDAQIARFLAKKPTRLEQVQEFWINALLSGPKTQAANIIGNSMMMALQFPEQLVSAAISKVGPKEARQSLAATPASLYGLMRAVPDALKAAASEFKLEADIASKVEYAPKIQGFTGRVVRTPGRLLSAGDALFKTLNRQAALYRDAVNLAKREGGGVQAVMARANALAANPTQQMLARADREGAARTFTKDLGETGQRLQRFANSPGVKFILPFVRTPANIVKEASRRMPSALIMPSFYKALRAGGVERADAIAQLTAGSLIASYMAHLAEQGQITGTAPSRPEKKTVFYASGKQPLSLRLGDQWVSYARVEPFATILGTVADTVRINKEARGVEIDKVANSVVQAIAQNITDKTFMQGLADVLQAFEDPDRFLERFAGSKIASFVPNILAQTAQTADPVLREARGMSEQIKARVPGLKETLPPRRDLFGREIPTGALGPDILSPFRVSPAAQTPAKKELERLGQLGLGIGQSQIEKERALTIGKQTIKLTDNQLDRYKEQAGALIEQHLDRLIASIGYASASDDRKIDSVRERLSLARRQAKARLLRELKGAHSQLP